MLPMTTWCRWPCTWVSQLAGWITGSIETMGDVDLDQGHTGGGHAHQFDQDGLGSGERTPASVFGLRDSSAN